VATCAVSMTHVCRVVGFSLTRLYTIQISVTPSDIGDGLIIVSKCSNSTFIMLHMYHEMDLDYLVVEEVLISNVD
jgi:hypothetical protein